MSYMAISCKNTPIESDAKINLCYLKYNNGNIILRPTHTYYTQCQFLMFCTGLTKCDFYVFNYIKPILITVERNNYFITQLCLKLNSFIFQLI